MRVYAFCFSASTLLCFANFPQHNRRARGPHGSRKHVAALITKGFSSDWRGRVGRRGRDAGPRRPRLVPLALVAGGRESRSLKNEEGRSRPGRGRHSPLRCRADSGRGRGRRALECHASISCGKIQYAGGGGGRREGCASLVLLSDEAPECLGCGTAGVFPVRKSTTTSDFG